MAGSLCHRRRRMRDFEGNLSDTAVSDAAVERHRSATGADFLSYPRPGPCSRLAALWMAADSRGPDSGSHVDAAVTATPFAAHDGRVVVQHPVVMVENRVDQAAKGLRQRDVVGVVANEEVHETVEAERASYCVAGFGDAVGVQQQSVTRFELLSAGCGPKVLIRADPPRNGRANSGRPCPLLVFRAQSGFPPRRLVLRVLSGEHPHETAHHTWRSP